MLLQVLISRIQAKYNKYNKYKLQIIILIRYAVDFYTEAVLVNVKMVFTAPSQYLNKYYI